MVPLNNWSVDVILGGEGGFAMSYRKEMGVS